MTESLRPGRRRGHAVLRQRAGPSLAQSGLDERTPDGLPIQVDCEDGDETCAPMTPWGMSTPGVVALSPACEVALELACKEEASVVTLDDVGVDLNRLWSFACRLPQRDVHPENDCWPSRPAPTFHVR